MNYLLPIRTDSQMQDGTFIEALSFCKKHCLVGECKAFYESIKPEDYNKFLMCPHGLSVFVASNNGSPRCFSCFRNRSKYDKKRAKRTNETGNIIYNPVLDSEHFLALIEYSLQNEFKDSILTEKQASIESISHEVKKLNAQIKDRSDAIIQNYGMESAEELSAQEVQKLLEKIKTIYVCSSMVNTRFSLLDYEKNPETLQQGATFDCNVYKKFDKMKIIFSNFLGRKVPIQLYGSSYRCISAYPSFEMIPLLIIDNAVKYSYRNHVISVNFREDANDLIVEVISYSPYCSENDLNHIYAKGFRGETARKVSDGSGIGLFFVKMLCNLHGINISASSDSSQITTINDVRYAPFKMTLTFQNTYTLS